MLVLIWSKERNVKEELIKAYYSLFFDQSRFEMKKIADNLLELFRNSNLAERTCLEELIDQIMNWNQRLDEKERDRKKDLYIIKMQVFIHIWEIFKKNVKFLNYK